VELEEEREAALGRMNALLDRAPDRAFAPPERINPVTARLPFDKVLALARSRHPDLAAAEAEIKVREAEAAAAARSAWPDLMVRGMYQDMREPPSHGGKAEDGWGVMLGLDLPFAFWSAPEYRAGYRASGVRADRARLELRDRENRLAADVRAALARIRSASEGLAVARAALVPQADQALQSVQAAYHAGKSSFMDLMDAYRMAIGARERELSAEVKVVRSRADLEAAAGMEFDALAGAAGGSRP
jgi:outer membrane protein TolC